MHYTKEALAEKDNVGNHLTPLLIFFSCLLVVTKPYLLHLK